ncbi:hypothetical protein Mal4_19940 [Maioricimonas rarisocia]|uniref:DUF1501 domain-containing protein n=1 Tax=Maioricimonas rarisocia TaxID=2528026 RepID=A0A517Z5B2_9PLAN|nr:DUF1501 domain-containing protein [Maioricimonas rarisocia]QDU37678.1 hypothetical protein Mal4_19940 [Maioricimonas rarisocia]
MTSHDPRESNLLSRRRLLQCGSAATLSLGLFGRLPVAGAAREVTPRANQCILIWLDGGPSHLDTFDLKPEAPEEVRGPFAPIDTSAPGIQVSEHLPETARQMQHVAVIRSMTSPLGEHNFGSHYLLTGYRPTPVLEYPGYGSVLSHLQESDGLLPANIAVPDHNPEGGAGFLPAAAAPFDVGSDPARPDFRVQDLDLFAGIDPSRLDRRKEFLDAFDRFSAGAGNQQPTDAGFEQAYRLIASGDAKRAFDLASEPRSTRDRYGRRTIGQACLLARRLVEAGVPFVTVRDRGWDTHTDLYNRLKEGFTGGSVGKVPTLDLAYSALLADLDERGLLDETLVILMGEFGRTPKINTRGGRDHWPRVFSVALAGGGITGGQVIGRSDAHAESPADRPVTPEDLARTVYTLLGIDPDHELMTPDGRPVAVNRGGELITEVL